VEARVDEREHAVGVEGQDDRARPDEDVLRVVGQEAEGGPPASAPLQTETPPIAATARMSRLSNPKKLVGVATELAAP
jgi:hypothetical protein